MLSGGLNSLPFVVIIAIVWHFGFAIYEHRHHPEKDRPSLAKLLLLAEIEVLRTLRAELKRRGGHKNKEPWESKLSRVEDRLMEIKEHEKET